MDRDDMETLRGLYESNGIRAILETLADFEEQAADAPCEPSPSECLSMARQLREVHA